MLAILSTYVIFEILYHIHDTNKGTDLVPKKVRFEGHALPCFLKPEAYRGPTRRKCGPGNNALLPSIDRVFIFTSVFVAILKHVFYLRGFF